MTHRGLCARSAAAPSSLDGILAATIFAGIPCGRRSTNSSMKAWLTWLRRFAEWLVAAWRLDQLDAA